LDFRSSDAWEIDEDSSKVYGSTIVDNFDMLDYLEQIGVPRRFVDMGGENC
jgi:hypothetical protein